jgi:hypothetical protein
MKHLILTLVAASTFVLGQEHAAPAAAPKGDGHAQAGGAEAVHPGGPAADHAQAAAKHGEGHESKAMPNWPPCSAG